MLKKTFLHASRGLQWLMRLMLWIGALLVCAGGALALVLEYRVLPDIERYHADIAAAASAAIGRPVTISRIEADWNGWRPRLLLSDVNVLDERGRGALKLPHVSNTLAWTTLLAGELRFYSLELDQPELLIRRDRQGRVHIAGMQPGGEEEAQADAAEADWVLHQSRIAVHGGRIVWQDELRGAPSAAFSRVELAFDNRRGKHRFAVQADFGQQHAAHLEVQGDLRGDSFGDFSDWQGELYAQLDHFDLRDWKKWLPLSDTLMDGEGAVRLWLQVEQGRVARADVDAALQNVQARLGEGLPLLDLRRLDGRIGWRASDAGFEISARKLALRMRDGFVLKPTDFSLSLSGAPEARFSAGEVSASELNLADFNALAGYFPFDPAFRKRLAELAPQGRVSDLQASWQAVAGKLARFAVHANFEDVGMRASGALPGFSGVSGKVEGNDGAGMLQIEGAGMGVQAPGFLAEPLSFDKLSARLDWQRNSAGWDLKLNDMQVSNPDFEGTVQGAYQLDGGPGVADITIALRRVSVRHAARYIPAHAFNDATYRWLQTGLQEGEADTFQMRVRGDLREFPFADGKHGLFRIDARANNVAIEFDPGWPRIERAAAQLLIEGRRLEVRATSAMTAGAALRHVSVVLPDTLADELVMQVSGESADEVQRCLDYIRKSPVRGYLKGYTDDFQAEGPGLLKLKLDIPLSGKHAVRVAGQYRFDGDALDLGPHAPPLHEVYGNLSFDNETLQAAEVHARILGGPARLSLRGDKGGVLTHASGNLDADTLPGSYRYPLLRQLHGSTPWVADIKVKDNLADVVVTSDLHGLSSRLPHPFAKKAEERVPLRFEQRDISTVQDKFKFSYGGLIAADLTRTSTESGRWEIRRGSVVIGTDNGKAGREGIWVTGELPRLSLEGWRGWSELPNREGLLPNIAGINVTFGQVTGYGSTVHQLGIRGSGRNGLISTRLSSQEINGDLIWQPQDEGKLLVRLKNAAFGDGGQDGGALQMHAPPPMPRTPGMSLPVIDVAIDKLSWKGRQLGRLEMLLESSAGDVLLERLRLSNSDAVFSASGKWSAAPEQTSLQARLEIINAGKILARSGYPEGLQGGSGTLEGELGWNGAPGDFSYGALNGRLSVKMGKGRFLQVNPGAAKLLGVLSLQALPKRISLDFNDVISPGFEFDAINGTAVIEHGMLYTNDLTMAGAAARISMRGSIDMERETQQLRVKVLPTIGDNVSLLSFAAGPAVGVGVLLANKLLSDPLDKLVSFDYNISGSWVDPSVTRVGQTQTAPAP